MKPTIAFGSVPLILMLATGPAYSKVSTEKGSGPYAGLEVGAVDHHFVLEQATSPSSVSSRNVTKWGVGGGVFAGYDTYLAPKLRLGVEASMNFGGQTPSTLNSSGQRFSIKPRYGYSLTVRGGYAIGEGLLVYGGGGYGGHRYRVSAPAGAAPFKNWNSSFILVGGVEYKVSVKTSVRLEFMHLDGTRNQIMVGVPIRF